MSTENKEVSGQSSVVSSTPRTDAKQFEMLSDLQGGKRYVVDADFARELEGELNAAKGTVTLTIREIRQLAEFGGLRIVKETPNPVTDGFDDEDVPITVEPCPEKGVLDDDKEIIRTRYIAYYEEYPEEGVIPLGPILSCEPAAEHRAGTVAAPLAHGQLAGGDACATPEGKP